MALMQFLAYSILLLRPAFAAITDKYRIKGYQRKYYIIFSGYSVTLIYIFIGLTFSNILIFGVLLILIYLSSTMLDVSTKSLVIDISPTNEIKKRHLFFMFVGEALGKFFPFFLFFLLISDIYSISSWETLIIYSYLLLIPLVSILPFITENNQKKPQTIGSSENFNISGNNNLDFSPRSKITIILLCIFVFFAFSDAIFIYPFFPFILSKFGLENFNLFNFFLIFYFLISITSSAIGSFIIRRIKPKKIIFILIPVIGIIYSLYNIVPFTFFTILYFIGCSLGTICNLNISVYIMKYKKEKKSMYFHLIASFRHLSTFIFLPLGTLLSNFVTTEYLIIIGAILLNLSLIPLIYIKL
ncbi:MAG: MFS transporter [Candidatus Hermodarchaeota archaeon]